MGGAALRGLPRKRRDPRHDRQQGGDRPPSARRSEPGRCRPHPRSGISGIQLVGGIRRSRAGHDAAPAGERLLSRFEDIDPDVMKRARLLYLNYPNNPTAATAGRKDSSNRPSSFCGENAISWSTTPHTARSRTAGRQQPLFPVAREAGIDYIELFSFSKTFSITGWRIGFAVGSPEVVSALARLKANIDSGVFSAIQAAAATALETGYTK